MGTKKASTTDLPRVAPDRRGKAAGRNALCAAAQHYDYLKVVGQRVHNLRARRGMTRKILARDSRVSERYLAQLESGQGNISIALLRQVAQAMSVPIEDLVRDGADRPVEFALLEQRLERLNRQDLIEAHRLLVARFGRATDDSSNTRIALIGLRAAGKTTLGRMLAQHIQVPFIEMHKEIEQDSGLSLSEIFSLSGQAAYRRYERRAIERAIEQHDRVVIATGGSLVSEPGTFDLVLTACYTVWIMASPEDHMSRAIAQGDLRPMAGNIEAMDDLRRILDERAALYAKADAAVDTEGRTVGQSFDDLVACVERIPAATTVG